MSMGTFINGIRIGVIVLVGLAVAVNYFFISIDNEDFFESKLMLFMNLIGLLLLIFLALLK